jgi:ceramide synthetase
MYSSCDEFYRYRLLERPDYNNSKWSDFWLVTVFTPIIMASQYLTKKYTKPYFVNKLKNKFSGEVLDQKANKSTKSMFKIVFFLAMTTLGYHICASTNYQSPLMFGNGNLLLQSSDWPYMEVPKYLKLYYMMELSYQVSDMIYLFILPAQGDFLEMLLHHYIAIMLISGSYMTNVWNSGINVLLQMDGSEVFIGILRGFHDIWPTLIVVVILITMIIGWAYFRVIVYSYEVLWGSVMTGRWTLDYNNTHQTAFQMLIACLLLLNVYWLLLFFKILHTGVTKGN